VAGGIGLSVGTANEGDGDAARTGEAGVPGLQAVIEMIRQKKRICRMAFARLLALFIFFATMISFILPFVSHQITGEV
jgi:hypothetical protein